MIDEKFICENCGKNVEKLNYTARDHCPFCLYKYEKRAWFLSFALIRDPLPSNSKKRPNRNTASSFAPFDIRYVSFPMLP